MFYDNEFITTESMYIACKRSLEGRQLAPGDVRLELSLSQSEKDSGAIGTSPLGSTGPLHAGHDGGLGLIGGWRKGRARGGRDPFRDWVSVSCSVSGFCGSTACVSVRSGGGATVRCGVELRSNGWHIPLPRCQWRLVKEDGRLFNGPGRRHGKGGSPHSVQKGEVVFDCEGLDENAWLVVGAREMVAVWQGNSSTLSITDITTCVLQVREPLH